MAVDTSGVNVTPSSSAKPEYSPEIVVAGGISDSSNGTTCHQCRQKNKTTAVACKNQKKNKPCCIKICDRCLWNRYGEKAVDIAALADWSCPKCRGICNCSVCMKRRGYQPTGLLSKKAKATGYASVSPDVSPNELEKLKHDKTSNDENDIENTKEISIHVDENDDRDKEDLVGDSEEEDSNTENADIPLPVGTELANVAGLDLHAEDVGNALQFLEFSFVFGKILELKKGEPEIVLQELLHGGTFSHTAQFHIHLLSALKTEQGKESATVSPSDSEKLWFQMLKNLCPASEILLKAADYDSLDASEKLRILNMLCDEVLGTEKVRNWIENENNEFLDKVREAKRKVHAAKGKEKSLKQKMKDDVTKAIIAKDGAPLSISEHEAIVSSTKSEAVQAHAEVLESESILMKSNKTCDALRIEPLFMEHRGNVMSTTLYWKLA
ncbi:hypothetical protein CDL12_25015 [Handroanthus impetiginosus]|uniref:DDT domain-containing protein n=1 Tax=Handroanthus impetiginosus TaxID=429701 RepID=A0A2G9GB10_9LAMI|nr:hypothetical protein CDL12_25015 [Handroanthus impetiginosus]